MPTACSRIANGLLGNNNNNYTQPRQLSPIRGPVIAFADGLNRKVARKYHASVRLAVLAHIYMLNVALALVIVAVAQNGTSLCPINASVAELCHLTGELEEGACSSSLCAPLPEYNGGCKESLCATKPVDAACVGLLCAATVSGFECDTALCAPKPPDMECGGLLCAAKLPDTECDSALCAPKAPDAQCDSELCALKPPDTECDSEMCAPKPPETACDSLLCAPKPPDAECDSLLCASKPPDTECDSALCDTKPADTECVALLYAPKPPDTACDSLLCAPKPPDTECDSELCTPKLPDTECDSQLCAPPATPTTSCLVDIFEAECPHPPPSIPPPFPLPRPPPRPPTTPGGRFGTRITFVVTMPGTVELFDTGGYKAALARSLPNVQESMISILVESASVRITSTITDPPDLSDVLGQLVAMTASAEVLSQALSLPVTSIDSTPSVDVVAIGASPSIPPSDPASPPPPSSLSPVPAPSPLVSSPSSPLASPVAPSSGGATVVLAMGVAFAILLIGLLLIAIFLRVKPRKPSVFVTVAADGSDGGLAPKAARTSEEGSSEGRSSKYDSSIVLSSKVDIDVNVAYSGKVAIDVASAAPDEVALTVEAFSEDHGGGVEAPAPGEVEAPKAPAPREESDASSRTDTSSRTERPPKTERDIIQAAPEEPAPSA